MGTLLKVHVEAPESRHLVAECVSEAIKQGHYLVNEVLAQRGVDFKEMLVRVQDLARDSGGAFDPFLNSNQDEVDVRGLAKGYVVDRMCHVLEQGIPRLSGCVNAGGDMRFVGAMSRKIRLKMGPLENPLYRDFVSPLKALASSSVNVSLYDSRSTTRYRGLDLCDSVCALDQDRLVVVSAEECWLADGLTKVGLFAPLNVLKSWERKGAQFFVFDGLGRLAYGSGITLS